MSELRERVDEPVAQRAVLAALRARRGVATKADLIVDTSLPETTVERALEALLDRYDSAYKVERGALVYRFAPGFRRRPERRPVLRALLAGIRRTGRELGRLARITFRLVLAVQLVTYLTIVLLPVTVVVGIVVGVVILIVGIFSDSGIGDLLTEPKVAMVVLALCVLLGIGWAFKQKVNLILGLLGAREVDSTGGKLDGLAVRVDAFALGPPRPARRREQIDRTWRISQADERRVLARIRAQGGVLRAGDLVAWLGFSFDEADAQATRLAVEYGGVPSASPESPVLELDFSHLLATAPPATGAKGAATADEPTSAERDEPAPPFTGNLRAHDAWIAVIAVANGLAGLIALEVFGARAASHWAWRVGALAAWPAIACSTLLIALPLLRTPAWWLRGVRARARQVRLAFVRRVVAHVRKARGPLDLGRASRTLALELGGQHDVDDVEDPTKTVWRFPRLEAELAPRRATASAAGPA